MTSDTPQHFVHLSTDPTFQNNAQRHNILCISPPTQHFKMMPNVVPASRFGETLRMLGRRTRRFRPEKCLAGVPEKNELGQTSQHFVHLSTGTTFKNVVPVARFAPSWRRTNNFRKSRAIGGAAQRFGHPPKRAPKCCAAVPIGEHFRMCGRQTCCAVAHMNRPKNGNVATGD